ncbi:MAG: helix-turn-helix domain-containing protein [Bacilli bacterium]|nr:helix-turn-helix domain-containing protein [Bacilli bacterium]
MISDNEFRKVVSENLQYYRKLNNLTQLQLAEILNYSDKSISKWERGESLPDLYVMQIIAELYGITINDFVTEQKTKPKHKLKHSNLLITLLSVGIVWLVATTVFVLLGIFLPELEKKWLAFIYAIPVSMIVLLVFTNIWGNRIQVFSALTVFYWSIPLSLYLSFNYQQLWLLFIIIIPLQILTILWFLLRRTTKIVIDSKGELEHKTE